MLRKRDRGLAWVCVAVLTLIIPVGSPLTGYATRVALRAVPVWRTPILSGLVLAERCGHNAKAKLLKFFICLSRNLADISRQAL